MRSQQCMVDGCVKTVSSRGLCALHYRREWSRGRFKKRRLPLICYAPRCCEPATRKGLCSAHYSYIRQAHRLATDPAYRAKRNRQSAESVRRHPEHKDARNAVSTRWHRLTNWQAHIAGACLHDAKRRHFPCDIDEPYIKLLWEQQLGRCHWLGIGMVPSVVNRHPLRPSIDKLDPSKGYTRGNVVLCTMFANMGRNNFPADAFRAFVEELRAEMKDTC